MDYLPIFLDVRQRRVLVVGDGAPARRKAALLCRAGAVLRVVAAGEFEAEAVRGCAAVFGATADLALDRQVADAARAAGVPVNIVDRPELSTFIMPAIVDRSPVVVAISSGAAAPVLARSLRARIEALLPARLGDLARFAGRFRGAVKNVIPDPVARRRFWELFFASPLAERVLAGDEQAGGDMVALVNRPAASGEGAVYLVGTGPGDPDLLTVQALRLMQQADIVLHDEHVGPAILERARRDAERLPLSSGAHDRAMQEAASGKRVLRLKGRTPFVFCRPVARPEAWPAAEPRRMAV